MHIESLTLRNIRSYENASINLSPGINLIIGENNSGKSTILKAIQMLQVSYSAINRNDIRKSLKNGAVCIKLKNVMPANFCRITNTRGVDGPNRTIQVLFEMRLNGRDYAEDSIVLRQPCKIDFSEDSAKIVPPIKGQSISTYSFVPFPASENEGNLIYPFLSKRKSQNYVGGNGMQSAVSVDDDLRNLPSKIKKLDNDSHPFSEVYKHYREEILGFKIGSASSTTNQTEDKIGLFVGGHETIYLESMGEGVANILGLFSILFTDSKKIFLIEELENDIHPSALKKLLNLIIEKSNNNQFIISTHSNIVIKYLASVEGTKIFYTQWQHKLCEPNNIRIPTSTIEEVPNTPFNRLEILEKLGYDLFDFDLYKSYILFEESSAEQIVRDFLIPEFVPELHTKVKTIGAKGVDKIDGYFDDFLRLFVYLNGTSVYKNRAWVIADGDPAGLENIAKLKAKFPDWASSNFRTFSQPYFEEYYPKRFKGEAEEIRKINDRRKRFEEKGKLTATVVMWINSNKEEAKKEFSVSAKEVIEILREIGKLIGS